MFYVRCDAGWLVLSASGNQYTATLEDAYQFTAEATAWNAAVITHGRVVQVDTPEVPFICAWDRLALQGVCDTFGGAEYDRVYLTWIQAGRPPEVEDFIRREANRLAARPTDDTRPSRPPAP